MHILVANQPQKTILCKMRMQVHSDHQNVIVCAHVDKAWREICYGRCWCWEECVPSIKSFLLGHQKKNSESSLILNSV